MLTLSFALFALLGCLVLTAVTAVHVTVRNAALDAAVDLLDAGGAGTLEFQTAASAEVATLTFSATAFGAASSGSATANAITNDTSATGSASPITKAVFKNNAGTALWTVTVTATGGGGDIELPATTIGAGATVGLSSLVANAPNP